MRLLAFLLLAALPTLAQPQPQFAVRRLPLPAELADADNQFSGLAVAGKELLLLSESRLQDHAEAKLYALALADLDHQLRDSTLAVPFRKLPITGLASLRHQMHAAGQSYEGLEALLVEKDEVYLSVETATPSSLCYLLRGRLTPTALALDTTYLLPLPKPAAPDGSHIYNAGYEALAGAGPQVLAFFEYNAFAAGSYVYHLPRPLTPASALQRLPVAMLPFRLTDVTALGGTRYVGINYFYKGGGGDAVYRTPDTDLENARLIRAGSDYRSYCRLVALDVTQKQVSWRPLWEFPERYWAYNWEGLAAHRGGFFVINDKYTPARPYQSVLLYLQPR